MPALLSSLLARASVNAGANAGVAAANYNNNKPKTKLGAIIGIVIGVVLILLALLIFFVSRRRKSRKAKKGTKILDTGSGSYEEATPLGAPGHAEVPLTYPRPMEVHQGPGVGVVGGGIGPGAGLSFPQQPVPYSSSYGQHPNGQQPTQMGYANAPLQGHVGEASDYYRNQ
ncbi:hypothetical protein BGZ60DRAFT_407596 [Tricladium varicosporioides]|nr:hypothetical protein BGZ60DRAFT_407596 [Hymenoscyphus varicosporioides]